MAWTGNVLRVNLTERTCNKESLNKDWALSYLGQRGLATKYLTEEIDPKIDALSTDNKLIMATGPLTGTPASTPPLLDAEPVRLADTWRPEIVPAGGFMEPPPPAPRALVLFVTITAPCDLRVQVDGLETVSRRFRAGEQLQIEARDEVIFTGDDAGALQFSINGQAGRMLGASGSPLGARIARDDYDAFLIGH